MTRADAIKLCESLTADEGNAGRLRVAFPDFDWRVIVAHDHSRQRAVLTILRPDPREHEEMAKRGAWDDDGRFIETPPAPPAPVNREAVTTLHGTPVEQVREQHAAQPTGMHADYIVLTKEERRLGYVRPVRHTYRHVGRRPKYPLRDLTPEEAKAHGFPTHVGAKFEEYPESERPLCGRAWSAADLASGCGTTTTMGQALAETYARDPGFYGATFCVTCGKHLPVGKDGEFVWDGTTERVGT